MNKNIHIRIKKFIPTFCALMLALTTQSGCAEEEETIDQASLTVELRNTGEGLAQVEIDPFSLALFELIHDDTGQSFSYTRNCLSNLCPSVTEFSDRSCAGDLPPTNIQTLQSGDSKVIEWDGLWFRDTEQGCKEPYQARAGESYTLRACSAGVDCVEETITLVADENRVTLEMDSAPLTAAPVEIEVRNDAPFAITLRGATPECDDPNGWLTIQSDDNDILPSCNICMCDAPGSCEPTCEDRCADNEAPLTLEPGQSHIYTFPGVLAETQAFDGDYLNIDEQLCAYPRELSTELLLDNIELNFGTSLPSEEADTFVLANDARLEDGRLIIDVTATPTE